VKLLPHFFGVAGAKFAKTFRKLKICEHRLGGEVRAEGKIPSDAVYWTLGVHGSARNGVSPRKGRARRRRMATRRGRIAQTTMSPPTFCTACLLAEAFAVRSAGRPRTALDTFPMRLQKSDADSTSLKTGSQSPPSDGLALWQASRNQNIG
jgi:hypothetical protein